LAVLAGDMIHCVEVVEIEDEDELDVRPVGEGFGGTALVLPIRK
jgi:hypothetical protein